MKKVLAIFLSLSIVLVCSLSAQACGEKDNDSQASFGGLISPAFADGGDGNLLKSGCANLKPPNCGSGNCPNSTESCFSHTENPNNPYCACEK